jgi:hypothetical protein
VNWETVAFLLESGIFLLMGLELKTLLDQDAAAGLSAGQAVGIGLAAASPRDQYRHLMLRVLAAERAGLLAARSAGRYRSRTLTRAQRALDLMEATLQQIPDLADLESSSDGG